jgi:segregation and condensation protein A
MKPELRIVPRPPAEVPPVEAAPQQVEMPFAVVNGEPVTQLPRDLYIPPQALEVFLEAFEGPLDLLLYLIRRQNLDILDIPLAEITKQYMKYIELMQDLQLELAGEYMVMAATLAEIKSRMLLPRPKAVGDLEEDPRAELVRRLQEYERFKRAAEDIDRLPRLERDTWGAKAELKDRKVVRLLPQLTLQEMLVAFKDVVARAEMFAHHHVQRERLSVRERMGEILTRLENSSFMEFGQLFRPEEGRMGVTVTFVAILELMREGLIDIVQAEPFAPLHVRSAGPNRNLRLVGDDEGAPVGDEAPLAAAPGDVAPASAIPAVSSLGDEARPGASADAPVAVSVATTDEVLPIEDQLAAVAGQLHDDDDEPVDEPLDEPATQGELPSDEDNA